MITPNIVTPTSTSNQAARVNKHILHHYHNITKPFLSKKKKKKKKQPPKQHKTTQKKNNTPKKKNNKTIP